MAISSIVPVSTDQEIFLVKKITAEFSDSTTEIGVEWKDADEPVEVILERKEFASGKTKRAFKVNLSAFGGLYFINKAQLRFKNEPGIFYAAKRHYDVGSFGEPTHLENMTHLKEELARQMSIQMAVKMFNQAAQSNKISIHGAISWTSSTELTIYLQIQGLQVATAFLLEVNDGPSKGLAWIVDPLMDDQKMRKFSGTNTAGSNDDFVGMTCDAFAHFTLHDSEMAFVPVDIQGQLYPVVY